MPHVDIYEVLKISYDGLDLEVQKIFLDIACFFKWDTIEYITSALEACGFHTYDGIDDLIKKSLIVISFDNVITMHDFVEAMGKEIVKQECDEDPGRRSRLWHHDDIYHVLTENTVTEKIEGIALDMSKLREPIRLNPYDFLKMRRLRFLKIYNSSSFEMINKVLVYRGIEYNLAALRHLSWHECSIKSPLSSLRLKNLVKLDMRRSKLEQLWNDVLPLVNLKEIDLSNSKLASCPNFSGFPNLKELNLSNCRDLHEISSSIGCLNKLDFLDLGRCNSLKEIPDCSGLISLRFLNIFGCRNLEMLPEIPCNLKTFMLSYSSRMEELKRLPSNFFKLKSLKALQFADCSKLDHLPNDIGSLESLKILCVQGIHLWELPSSMMDLKNLKDFQLDDLDVWIEESLDGMHLPYLSMRLSKREMVECLSTEQLGGTCANNQSVLEVLSCLPTQDIVKSDYEDIVKDILHGLQKIKQMVYDIQLNYLGCEVPKWFMFRSVGNSVSVKQSSHWFNHNFMGFVLCFVVAPSQQPEEVSLMNWICQLKPKDGHTLPGHLFYLLYKQSDSSNVIVQSLVLPFLCGEFEFFAKCNDKDLKIDQCGVHLMFSQHIEEVGESSRIVNDENIFTFAKCLSYNEEDQPHPKRLKNTPN